MHGGFTNALLDTRGNGRVDVFALLIVNDIKLSCKGVSMYFSPVDLKRIQATNHHQSFTVRGMQP